MNAGWGLWPRISWNPPDFTLKSGGFHLWNLAEFTQISSMKSTQNYKSKCFSKNSSVWWMQGGGYDQGFHEIRWISPVKSAWNPPDFKIMSFCVMIKYRSFVFRKTNNKKSNLYWQRLQSQPFDHLVSGRRLLVLWRLFHKLIYDTCNESSCWFSSLFPAFKKGTTKMARNFAKWVSITVYF